MTISKYHNYIKLTSFANELNDFTIDSFTLTGNINCCQQNCTDFISTFSFDLNDEELKWSADLSEAVKLKSELVSIGVQSIYSTLRQNIDLAIDLSSILTDCIDSSCTIETSPGTILTTIRDAIDAYFLSISVASSVTVTASGNIITVENIPTNFIITDFEYGEEEPFTSIPFGQSVANSNLYYFDTEEEAIYIKPGFFNNATEFRDGIYKFSLKWIKENNTGFITEENCAFIDITTKCRVAGLLNNVIKENADPSLEKIGGTVMKLHYGLVNGSNCACNCDGLCEVYKGLIEILDTVDPNITNDCGC